MSWSWDDQPEYLSHAMVPFESVRWVDVDPVSHCSGALVRPRSCQPSREGSVSPLICLEKQCEVWLDTQRSAGRSFNISFQSKYLHRTGTVDFTAWAGITQWLVRIFLSFKPRISLSVSMRGERVRSLFYVLSVHHVFASFYKGQLCSHARSVQLSAHKALSFQNTI